MPFSFRYLHCFGTFQPYRPQLQEFFQHYPDCSQPYEKPDLSFLLQNRLPEAASLQEQCDAISLIPNYPKLKPKSFSGKQKLPVLGKCPFSIRGTIIWASYCPKRSKYLKDTCSKLCSQKTLAAVDDVVMDEPPHQMDHHEPQQAVHADGQSYRQLTPDTIPSALQHEDQSAAANLGSNIVYIHC